MKEKLIAIDIDGTLVGSSLKLSPFTITTLQKIIAEGHHIILASGRPYRSLLPYYQVIGSHDPTIAYNGSLIIDPTDPDFPVFKRSFDVIKIQELAKKVAPYCFVNMAESFHVLYVSQTDPFLERYFPAKSMEIVKGPLFTTIKENVYTFICGHNDENSPKISEIVTSFSGIGYRHWSKCPYSEIYPLGVSKGEGLKYVAKKMGFSKEDIIAFGDSDNDYEMLQESGLAFAMKGSKSVHLASSFPLSEDTAENNGVAKTLANLLINE